MSKLSVGLVGLGIMGKNHARVLANLDSVKLIGVVEPLQDKLIHSSNLNIVELDELLEMKPDYCVVATPAKTHKDIAIKILESGINCLIEKPVTLDIDSALEIKKVAERNSLVVGVGHIERYNSAIRQLKLKLDLGELGEILQISTRRKGQSVGRISDTGVVKDLGTHDIDLILYLTGSRFKSLTASISSTRKHYNEDLVIVSGMLENNSIFDMHLSRVNPVKERKLEILGEKGVFIVNMLNSELGFYSNTGFEVKDNSILHTTGGSVGSYTNYAFEKTEALVLEHENFRDFLLGKKAEIVSLEDGISSLSICEQILHSSRV
jgi:predicted dehydrogenase